ncbi:MAG: ComF family protein [Levilactobacillus sp.]|uniref:ComF family protein n=1 Tax=Levilactobacillus sp. TaxID=2767919 RepID=UPI00258CE946|nr:ComF family protein [Levilactobacillus sp.]MCH4124055.1 ComF family protein [Levilactobacillus sp.]MCI1554109.1 ComF family protein [Levilactobacillus sp.]MCI1599947.1 ComF family protein [Levilactobacillus sp.]MCI1606768.1 ComF family protein [Levilactobacillus sp.]
MNACVWCGRRLGGVVTVSQLWRWGPLIKSAVCAACQTRLTPISILHCPQCGRQQTDETICRDCQRWTGPPLVNHALYVYDAAMKAYMQQYKFQGDFALRRVLQEPLRLALARETYDVLVPIPVDQATWQQRGFNQVTGWLQTQPFQQALLVRASHKDQPQSAKDRAARLQTAQPFILAPHAADVLMGQRVLLLDDVYTTGRTLRHAAAQIYLGGAKAVTSLTLAR